MKKKRGKIEKKKKKNETEKKTIKNEKKIPLTLGRRNKRWIYIKSKIIQRDSIVQRIVNIKP